MDNGWKNGVNFKHLKNSNNGWYWENEDSHQSSKGFGMDKNGTVQLIWGEWS